MSNQIILWSMLIVPWITLFFMKKKDIRRYAPAGLFSLALSSIVIDAGVRLGFWTIRETIFPLNEMLSYLYGLFPILTMWVLKFTNGNFIIYMITNAILDIGFSFFLVTNFMPSRGIIDANVTGFQDWLLALGRAAAIYVYQKWQEGEPIRLRTFGLNLQPAATKPMLKDKNKDNE
ncbi:Hypothetical protein LUCI_0305 [Lucifera butyrica]|uniref:Uncharacterized protein n=1 Tax=Lucifera butyrica TaxID=1351585 RepID=A0A498R1R9_9FIRM|nr:hypothetical protein [Lucifera butyrica]VBB05099.1 Hypothetical protein LUCI_0305 [Lucifera butyrica]